MKRLYKSNKDIMIAGVCAGIAEYFNVDPTLIRLLWLIFGLTGGTGIFAYIVASIIIPRRPDDWEGGSHPTRHFTDSAPEDAAIDIDDGD